MAPTPRNTELADRLDDRDLQLYAIAIENILSVPFGDLVVEAARTGECEKKDLLEMGERIYHDLVRLARGEISEISIPARLPRKSEYAPAI